MLEQTHLVGGLESATGDRRGEALLCSGRKSRAGPRRRRPALRWASATPRPCSQKSPTRSARSASRVTAGEWPELIAAEPGGRAVGPRRSIPRKTSARRIIELLDAMDRPSAGVTGRHVPGPTIPTKQVLCPTVPEGVGTAQTGPSQVQGRANGAAEVRLWPELALAGWQWHNGRLKEVTAGCSVCWPIPRPLSVRWLGGSAARLAEQRGRFRPRNDLRGKSFGTRCGGHRSPTRKRGRTFRRLPAGRIGDAAGLRLALGRVRQAGLGDGQAARRSAARPCAGRLSSRTVGGGSIPIPHPPVTRPRSRVGRSRRREEAWSTSPLPSGRNWRNDWRKRDTRESRGGNRTVSPRHPGEGSFTAAATARQNGRRHGGTGGRPAFRNRTLALDDHQ